MNLRSAWEENARDFVAWVRRPGLDSYRFHRDQFLEIVPEPGRLTVDIGCGEGRLSRDLKARGHDVVGVDGSPTMLEFARAADASIPVHLADAAELPLPDGAADLAIAFMSLHDVDDMPRAILEAARVLIPGGRLCLAIVHPLNSAGAFESAEPGARFVIDGAYLDRFDYADAVERDGLSMTFHSRHRPLEDFFSALAAAGFAVEALREHAVPEREDPRWRRIPLFLHLRATSFGP
jgi:SAM-dependent methyltransferase